MDDKVQNIYQRRSMKEDTVQKILHDKNVEQRMLKEVHNLRQTNAQINIQREKERMRKY